MKLQFLGSPGARGRLRDAAGRNQNGFGMPSWTVLAAAKLAVLGAKFVIRCVKLALSSTKLAGLRRSQARIERVVSANPFPNSV